MVSTSSRGVESEALVRRAFLQLRGANPLAAGLTVDKPLADPALVHLPVKVRDACSSDTTLAVTGASEYSMEVDILPATDAVGGATFVAQISVVHDGVTVASGCFNGLVNGVDDDGDTIIDEADEVGLGEPFAVPPSGCYTAAQWSVDYDQTLVDLLPLGTTGTTGVVKVAAAPGECNRKNDNGARALAGCANVAPPPNAILAYTGPAFNLTFDCIAAGTAVFTLVLGVDETFVSDGVADLPVHTVTDSISCTGP